MWPARRLEPFPVDRKYSFERDGQYYPGPDIPTSFLVSRDIVVPVAPASANRVSAERTGLRAPAALTVADVLGRYGHVGLDERIPVVGTGEHRNPHHLAHLFRHLGDGVVVVRALLKGVDVVYPATINPYGIIPSTLAPSPGTTVAVPLLLLTAAQLEVLQQSAEIPAHARLARLAGCRLLVDSGAGLSSPTALVSRYGLLAPAGRPRRLRRVRATRSAYPDASLAGIVRWLRPALGAAGIDATSPRSLQDAVLRDPRARARVQGVLDRWSQPSGLGAVTVAGPPAFSALPV